MARQFAAHAVQNHPMVAHLAAKHAHSNMPYRFQRFVRITTLFAAALGGVVACDGGKPVGQEIVEMPKPKVNLASLRPPILITLERTAEWDKPTNIPAPQTDWSLDVEAPVLEPMPVLVADQPEVDEPTPDVITEEGIATMVNLDGNTAIQSTEVVEEFKTAQISPGQIVRTHWTAGESLHGAQIPTPVLVAEGVNPGPVLCVTAAVHGDELNGIEAVRRLMYSINPQKLSGRVVGVPIVNLQGFQRHSRYLADRRDLNRFFPGNPRGSSASRMAYSFFSDVISTCDGLVDLHTGSFHRTNLPQLRADLQNPDVLELTKGFGATVILHSTGGQGTLRRAAVDAGIPAVTLEAGEPLRLQDDAVEHTVKALFTLLDTMEMYNKRSLWGNPEPTYYSSSWVRADQGGILTASVKLGRRVKEGDMLGKVTDPISNEQVDILAPYSGRIIGMALNQFVMPGFATFHIATEGDVDNLGEGDNFHVQGVDVAINESLSGPESE